MTSLKSSIDYSDFIKELTSELNDKVLTQDEIIQVLRKDTPIFDDYFPIIDWYYSPEMMIEVFALEDTDEADAAMNLSAQTKYAIDKPSLELISLRDCLKELKEWERILSVDKTKS